MCVNFRSIRLQLDVFIPAGTGENLDNYGPLLEQANVKNKALIQIAGKPMINYVLEALDKAKHVKSITIAGLSKNQLSIQLNKPVTYIPGGTTTFDTIVEVIKHFQSMPEPPKFIMSVSSDIPLTTGEMIDRYISSIDWTKEKEYYWPLVRKEDLIKHYPNVTKLPLKFKEGSFLGAEIHIFQPQVFSKNETVLKEILANRKKFRKIVRIISLRNIIRYMLGRLTFDITEDIFKKKFNLNGAYVIFDYPEICVDLDYMKDLDEFEKLCSQPRRKLGPNESVTINSKYW